MAYINDYDLSEFDPFKAGLLQNPRIKDAIIAS